MIHRQVLTNAGLQGKHGYAFGLGLERLAMVLFGIPDIRLFWSDDPRFLSQFQDGVVRPFEPYSKYPPCYKVHARLPPSSPPPSPLFSLLTAACFSVSRHGAGGVRRTFPFG